MALVFYDKETNTRGEVILIHNQPELLTPERRAEGIQIEVLPEEREMVGKKSVLYVNPETAEVWWEYKDRPLTMKEMVADYEKRLEGIKKSAQIATKDKIIANELSDEDLLALVNVYPDWDVGVNYEAGDVINYHNKLWEILQSHTSQADWSPDVAVSLFAEKTPSGVIAEWKQPEGSHDAYDLGDQVYYEGQVFESTINANVWSPTAYPEGWELV